MSEVKPEIPEDAAVVNLLRWNEEKAAKIAALTAEVAELEAKRTFGWWAKRDEQMQARVKELEQERDAARDRMEDYQGRLWCALGQPEGVEFIEAVKMLKAENARLKAEPTDKVLCAAVTALMDEWEKDHDGYRFSSMGIEAAKRYESILKIALPVAFRAAQPNAPQKRYRLNAGQCAAQVVDCDCRGCRPDLEDPPKGGK